MKIIFTLGSPAIGGGTNVIFEHAGRLEMMGHDVTIVCDRKIAQEEYVWHSLTNKLKFTTYDELCEEEFDVAIATWWVTVYHLYKINAKKYIYFVQSIESKFYKDSQYDLKFNAELTYQFNLPVITEATWIKKYLEERYDAYANLVLNGIRKDIYSNKGETFEKGDGLRVLVEGPVDVDFKNIPKTVELVKQSKAKEIWMLTSSDITSYPGVDRVFSRIKPSECPKIYRSCDVLVKLSYVEGMFGPPLEMYHCGGTAIVYDVTGHDEYITNKNGIIVKTNDDDKVIAGINKLTDAKTLAKYKKEALLTASKWPSWEESSKDFEKAIIDIINNTPTVSRESLRYRTNLFNGIYEAYVNKKEPVIRVIGRVVKKISPFMYEKVNDIRRKLKK